MLALPSFPPAFQLVALDGEVDAFARAVGAAPRGIEDGTIFWSGRDDLLDMALVLEPDTAALPALDAVYLLAVAACETLARLVPPEASVACAWPGDLLLDGARVGAVRAVVAPTADPAAPPPWLVLGLRLQLTATPGGPVDSTSLTGQGGGEAGAAALLAVVSRRLLDWTARRRTDGPASVYAAWNRRCFRRGEQGVLSLDGEPVAGTIAGLDAEGRFTIGLVRLLLTDALGLLA